MSSWAKSPLDHGWVQFFAGTPDPLSDKVYLMSIHFIGMVNYIFINEAYQINALMIKGFMTGSMSSLSIVILMGLSYK